MGHLNDAAIRVATLFLTTSLLMAGCSSSSDSPALSEDDNVVSDINSDATTAQPEADSISSGASDEVIVSANEPIEEANELLAPSSDNIPAETIDNEQNSEPTTDAIPDPLVLNSTQVDFGITVPAYQSDAWLIWGDSAVTAGWVSDELWTTSLVLPTDTENTLSVTFSDSNGDIVLASFEQAYRTGSNAVEMFNIAAEQFTSEQWDADNDGISNLDELIAGTNPDGDSLPQPVQANLEYMADKTFHISWGASEAADHYQVLEASTNGVGFMPVSGELDSTSLSFDHRVALYNRVNARYIVKACNGNGCTDSDELIVSGTLEEAIGHFTGSNDEESLGGSAALSADGSTLVISGTGGQHIFVRNNENWQLQTLLPVNGFPSLSANGDTLAIGVSFAGDITDIESPIVNDPMFAAPGSGAVYVFARMNGNWEQQVLLRASTSGYQYHFGQRVSISADGNTLAVSTPGELNEEGAAYVFTRDDGSWQEQAYLKASNPEGQICNSELPDCYRWGDAFGTGLDLSDDGNTLAIGAPGEDSAAIGINGDQGDNSSRGRGAVYVFVRNDETWQQQAYLKANFDYDHPTSFGEAVALSATGDTLAVGTPGDDSIATGINGVQSGFINEGVSSGAVYVFERAGVSWQQQAFVKASNTDRMDDFGGALSLSADGNTLAVGASQEDSAAIGINGDQADNSATLSGAAYVLTRTAGVWQQRAYLKAIDTQERDRFGVRLSLSADGQSLVVSGERSTYLY